MASHRNPFLQRRSGFRLNVLALSMAAAFAGPAAANPMGAQVANGTASISAAGNTLTITNSAGAVINWQSFSIGANEVTRFVQPSATSAVLNRVVANNPSELLGQLTSNGRVFLINPAGILVGAGARVDTAGFVASTLNLSNADFLAGRLNFTGDAGAGGIVNRGEIVTPAGGSVYLIGANVSNEGVIRTPGGESLLAAGQSVRLIDTGTPGVSVEIGGGGQAANLGEIAADAGRIGIAGALVRQAGTASASSVVREGGRIFLKASGRAEVDGGVTQATSNLAKGGRIEVTGTEVAIEGNALLDASGATGGGQILVGGGYQGKDTSLANADSTRIGTGAALRADALDEGDGGLVVAWANGQTTAKGSFTARGGLLGGNGGVVETSGKSVDFLGVRVDTMAARGKVGNWLIDPYDLTIGSAEAGTIGSNLTTGDVTIEATSSACVAPFSCTANDANGNGLSDIFIRSPITKNAGTPVTTLIMKAEGDIEFFDSSASYSTSVGITGSATGALNVNLEAGRTIVGNPWGPPNDITTNGTVTLKAGIGIGGAGGPFVVDASSVDFSNTTSGTVYLHSMYANPISIKGTNSGTGSVILRTYNGLIVPSAGISSQGDVQISTRNISVLGQVSTPAGKTVYVGPYTSENISINGGSTLDLTSAEMGLLNAGKLVVGTDGFGNTASTVSIYGPSPVELKSADVTIVAVNDINLGSDAAITVPTASTATQSLALQSGGSIHFDSGASISGTATAPLHVKLLANGTSAGGAIVLGSGSTGGFISTYGGDIFLGGGTDPTTGHATGTGGSPQGIRLRDFDLMAGGGSITLRGRGMNAASNAVGVEIEDSAVMTSSPGSIRIVGLGGIGTSVTGNDGIRLNGEDIFHQDGGQITLEATAGTGGLAISQLAIIPGGSIDSVGGTVNLNAVSGDVRLAAEVTADGDSGAGVPRNGGTVNINVSNGNLLIDPGAYVTSLGTDGSSPITTGAGGNIHLLAPNGSVTINGWVSANGGANYGYAGPAGAGGNVTVSAASVAVNGLVEAVGGSSHSEDPTTQQGYSGGAGGSVYIAATSGSIAVGSVGIIDTSGGDGADGGTVSPGGNGGNGGAAGAMVLSGAAGVSNQGLIAALGGTQGFASGTGVDGLPGAPSTVVFRSSAGGVTSTTGILGGHIILGDAGGNIAGNANINTDSYSEVHSWQGRVGGAANIVSDGPITIGPGGLRAGSIKLASSIIQSASQVGTSLDTSAGNGTLWLIADILGTSSEPVSLKAGTGTVKLDVAGDFNVRFDEHLVSSRLQVCEPTCGTISSFRTAQIGTSPGFDITIVPEVMAGVQQPYGVDGDHIFLKSGRNIVFSGTQAGFTDAGAVTLKALGGIYAPGVVTAIDTSAHNGPITLEAREIAGPAEGLTINPGAGMVHARVTNGGMHLTQVTGDLSTSKYILVNDNVGSNTHLTALAGNILIDGVAGFGATTQDDELNLSADQGAIAQTSTAPLVAKGLFATARNGIALTAVGNGFGEFTALNTTSGDIRMVNTHSPLLLGADSVTGLVDVTNDGGDVFIDNTGGIVSEGAIKAAGTVGLTAHSPITLNGPVTGSGVVLLAMGSTAGNDTITINAPITAGAGGVSATAATGIVLGATGSIVTAGPRTLTAPRVVDPTTTSLVGQSAQQQVVASTLTTTTGLSPAASGASATTGTTSPAVTVVATTSTTTAAASPLLTGTTIGGGAGEFGGTDSAASSAPTASSSSSESQKSAGSGDKNKQATASSNQKREGKDAPKKPAQCTG